VAHEIEIVDGKGQAFFVNTPAWHGLGHVLPNAPTMQEGIVLAGLDWTVSLRDVTVAGQVSKEHKGVVRDSDESLLGVVKSRFTPQQNADVFAFFQPFLETGRLALESAGSLFKGKRVWVLAKVLEGGYDVGGGDRVDRYVLFSHAHDGSLQLSARLTDVRVVCNNTLRSALGAGDVLFKAKHTKNARLNMMDAQARLANALSEASVMETLFREAKAKLVSEGQRDGYLREVLGLAADSAPTRVLESLHALANAGTGIVETGSQGTAWAAYNSVTEYFTHRSSRTKEAGLNANMFGQANALDAATELLPKLVAA
jgi:phage/plasmid-like protein (TIGR03299 family)